MNTSVLVCPQCDNDADFSIVERSGDYVVLVCGACGWKLYRCYDAIRDMVDRIAAGSEVSMNTMINDLETERMAENGALQAV